MMRTKPWHFVARLPIVTTDPWVNDLRQLQATYNADLEGRPYSWCMPQPLEDEILAVAALPGTIFDFTRFVHDAITGRRDIITDIEAHPNKLFVTLANGSRFNLVVYRDQQ